MLDFNDYMKATEEHLESKHELPNGDKIPFYTKVESEALESTKSIIKKVLQEGLDNQIITKDEADAMNPNGATVGKFYTNSKVHKAHKKYHQPDQ